MLRSVAVVVLVLGLVVIQAANAWEEEDDELEMMERFLEEEMEEVKKSDGSRSLSIVGKTTWQSTTMGAYSSDKAVDGSPSTSLYPGEKCMHTSENFRDPWWMVDLGDTHCISKVRILNRGDCCSDRLEGAVVRVGASVNPTTNAQCGSPVTAAQAKPRGGTVEFNCQPVLAGRYVSVDIPGRATLQLCEVTVEEVDCSITQTRKLTLTGKETKQSTTYSNLYGPEKAVEGNPSTSMYPDSRCTHTAANSDHPWWSVDLGEEQCITKVAILNRGDCCSKRLTNAIVRAGNFKTVTANQACGGPITASQAAPLGATIDVACDRPLRARYVSVDIPGRATLQLCEVYVWALASNDC